MTRLLIRVQWRRADLSGHAAGLESVPAGTPRHVQSTGARVLHASGPDQVSAHNGAAVDTPIPGRSVPTERAEERCHVRGEQLRSLERREVATPWHLRPPLDVEDPLGERARRMPDLAREGRVGGGRAGTREGNGPRLVPHGVVRPERRVDRTRDPVERDVGQEPVDVDRGLGVAGVVGPRVELLGDPGRESRRRIGQGIRRRLRSGALDG